MQFLFSSTVGSPDERIPEEEVTSLAGLRHFLCVESVSGRVISSLRPFVLCVPVKRPMWLGSPLDIMTLSTNLVQCDECQTKRHFSPFKLFCWSSESCHAPCIMQPLAANSLLPTGSAAHVCYNFSTIIKPSCVIWLVCVRFKSAKKSNSPIHVKSQTWNGFSRSQ